LTPPKNAAFAPQKIKYGATPESVFSTLLDCIDILF
jgi:hypothetical protein